LKNLLFLLSLLEREYNLKIKIDYFWLSLLEREYNLKIEKFIIFA
jgi:hypothetical protein